MLRESERRLRCQIIEPVPRDRRQRITFAAAVLGALWLSIAAALIAWGLQG